MKAVLGISPFNTIEHIEIGEQYVSLYQDYQNNVSQRIINLSNVSLYFVDIVNNTLPSGDEYNVIYIDTKYADKGFMKAAVYRDRKKNVKHLTAFLPEDVIGEMVLTFGEENVWSMFQIAGFAIYVTVPKSVVDEAINKLQDKIKSI